MSAKPKPDSRSIIIRGKSINFYNGNLSVLDEDGNHYWIDGITPLQALRMGIDAAAYADRNLTVELAKLYRERE